MTINEKLNYLFSINERKGGYSFKFLFVSFGISFLIFISFFILISPFIFLESFLEFESSSISFLFFGLFIPAFSIFLTTIWFVINEIASFDFKNKSFFKEINIFHKYLRIRKIINEIILMFGSIENAFIIQDKIKKLKLEPSDFSFYELVKTDNIDRTKSINRKVSRIDKRIEHLLLKRDNLINLNSFKV